VTPAEIGARLVELVEGASYAETFGEVTIDVPALVWVDAALAARDDPELRLSYFDWLSAVDQEADGYDVVLHVYSIDRRHRALLRTRVSAADPVLPSLAAVFPGAGWHERETYEMFGVGFTGHPGLTPLLLPDGFEGHPLRKEFVLASRVIKEWPGAREPGESHTGATRRRMRPPGVPDPEVWGPDAAVSPPGPAVSPPGPAVSPPGAGAEAGGGDDGA
jgi:NADH-quinone oxidoreductase subunit C